MHLPLLMLLTALCASSFAAELDATRVAVVYNADSIASRTVAQAWMRLRGLNPQQAIPVSGISWQERTDLSEFRRGILAPMEATLRARGLAERTAIIAYAPDVPLNLWFTTPVVPNGQRGPGSLTGLTLLAPLLERGWEAFTAPYANPYREEVPLPGAVQDQLAAGDARQASAAACIEAKDLAGAEKIYAALAEAIPAPSVLYNLACVQALLGRNADALSTLDRAVTAGWCHHRHTSRDGDLTALHGDPAWPILLARMQALVATLLPAPSPSFSPTPAVTEADGQQSSPGRLAMVLAVTSGRGQAIDAAVAQLTTTRAADGTHPTGTVWFMASTDDARTGPRAWAFAAAAAALRAAGVAAEVRDGILPPPDAPVIGAMIGASDFDWPANGSRMLPGAWCDHLTSWSGAMQPGGGQTPITAYLQAGAAGSGGAVHEPFNIPLKFPSAFIHLHRVRGLSLVEAVHVTMAMPFQYLAVGDPLSRPWSAVTPLAAPQQPMAGATLELPTQAVWGAQVPFRCVIPAGIPDAEVVIAHLGRVLLRLPPRVTHGTLDTRKLAFGINEIVLGRTTDQLSITELSRSYLDVGYPTLLAGMPDPGPQAPRWRFTETFWPPPPTVYPAATSAGELDEAWLHVTESGLHQVQWSSSRLQALCWNDGPERELAAGPASEPVMLAPGWHRLRLRFAAGDTPCEIRFGRHGTMPIESERWRQLQPHLQSTP